MERREFLVSVGGVVGVAISTRTWAQGSPAKLARVAVSSRNFDAIIKQGAGPAPSAARTLDFLDLPQAVADKLGVHNLELQHAHFVSTEDAYLKDLRDRVAKAKSQIVQINTDFQTSNVSAAGFSARAQGIDLAKVWIDHAEALGCPRVLITPGSLAADTRTTAVEALKILAEYGRAHKVTVTMDNRDTGATPTPTPAPAGAPAGQAQGAPGAAAGRGRAGGAAAPAPPPTWQVVAEVAKAAGIAITPDSAGFPNDAERAAGLKALYPLSSGVSRVRRSDLAAAVKIAKDAAYKGLFVVTSGDGDPMAATKAAIDELVKLI